MVTAHIALSLCLGITPGGVGVSTGHTHGVMCPAPAIWDHLVSATDDTAHIPSHDSSATRCSLGYNKW